MLSLFMRYFVKCKTNYLKMQSTKLKKIVKVFSYKILMKISQLQRYDCIAAVALCCLATILTKWMPQCLLISQQVGRVFMRNLCRQFSQYPPTVHH